MNIDNHRLLPNINELRGALTLLIDVDGVLLDNTHRLHHITEIGEDGLQKNKSDGDWDAYNSEALRDKPLPLCNSLNRLMLVFDIVFLSARKDTPAQVNIFTKCMRPFLSSSNWFFQFMPVGYNKPAASYKRDIVKDLKRNDVNIMFAIDDSLDNTNMYKSEGICALRCHDVIEKHNLFY